MRLAYHVLDVFTDRPLAGNPLAVFLEGEGVDAATMQAIARELNLSETVFVLPASNAGALRWLRIFTPDLEMPFAGHPTIGTAVLLARAGIAPIGDFVLEENVGAVPVRVRRAGELLHARLTVEGPPERRPAPPADAVAAMLGLAPDDLAAGRPPAAVSAGFPFLMVFLRDVDALGRARVDTARWSALLADAWARDLYLVAPAEEPGADLRARMFAPQVGISEDPATGSAATALAGLLAANDAAPEGAFRWTVLQGVEMGRPSRVELEADKRGGEVVAAHVGGTAIEVGTGELTL